MSNETENWNEVVVEKVANGYKVYPYGEEGRIDTEYVYFSLHGVICHLFRKMGYPENAT